MKPEKLLCNIIKPCIDALELDSGREKNIGALLLYTSSQESHLVYYRQLSGGPALSLWQVEPNTYHDCYENYLVYRKPLLQKILDFSGYEEFPDASELEHNQKLACAIARIVYRRSPLVIPQWNDIEGMWKIYKECYNTHLGKAQKHEFIEAFERVIHVI